SRPPGLEAQKRRDRLQVVLYTVVNLLDHRGLDPQLLLLAPLLGHVADNDENGLEPPGPHPEALKERLAIGRQGQRPAAPGEGALLRGLAEARARLERLEKDR